LAARGVDERAGDALELGFDDLVIIATLRIGRDRAALTRFEHRERVAIGTVVEPQHDDGAHFGPERARIAPARRRRLHPVHVAVQAFGEKLPEPRLGAGNRVGPDDARDLEAVRAGELADRTLALSRVAQKSRSA